MPQPQADRLGALPDEALQHVLLSFLPLLEAVRTGTLARRYRHLWKYMPVLRITSEGRVLNRRGVRRLNSARLDACEIELVHIQKGFDVVSNIWHVIGWKRKGTTTQQKIRLHLSKLSTYAINIEQTYIQRSVIHSEGNSAIDTVTATAEDLLAAAAATDPLRYHSQLPKYSAPISQRPPQANLYP
uniref:F-box domain-containing protein n=1 Tax=Oryza punctata TaxID=4537 RepID=A0A0E0MDL0_ORYPU